MAGEEGREAVKRVLLQSVAPIMEWTQVMWMPFVQSKKVIKILSQSPIQFRQHFMIYELNMSYQVIVGALGFYFYVIFHYNNISPHTFIQRDWVVHTAAGNIVFCINHAVNTSCVGHVTRMPRADWLSACQRTGSPMISSEQSLGKPTINSCICVRLYHISRLFSDKFCL